MRAHHALLHLAALPLLLTATWLQASPWHFSQPIDVAARDNPKRFHHIDSSGRRNIATNGVEVAVVWEDERDGTPRIYLARKRFNKGGFGPETTLSGSGDAFEPTIIALPENRFAIAWEESGKLHARVVADGAMGESVIVDRSDSVQSSLAYHDNQLLVVGASRRGRFNRIFLHRLAIGDDLSLHRVESCPVDAEPLQDDQLYPTISLQNGLAVVAWEDRRPGHTIIMAAKQLSESRCRFHPPRRISEEPGGPPLPYGAGHGVTRVALTGYGESGILAAWADKRNFREGYDIYAAHHEGNGHFSVNQRVQDDFSGLSRQWHTTVAGASDGQIVVGWDDDREGNSDLYLSWFDGDEWSDDLPLPGASGDGEQSHPTLTLDSRGNLHIAWIERDRVGATTRLRYLIGTLGDE